MNLCLICLRTDRLLKIASNVLKEFHDELCGFSVVTMTSSFQYCTDCESLLIKFYKFKEKCVKALKICEKWMSDKASKKQVTELNLLHTLLVPSLAHNTLIDNATNILNFSLQLDTQPDTCIKEELMKYTVDDRRDNIADVIKTENVSGISDSLTSQTHTDKMKNDRDTVLIFTDNLGALDVSDKRDDLKNTHDSDVTDKKEKSKKVRTDKYGNLKKTHDSKVTDKKAKSKKVCTDKCGNLKNTNDSKVTDKKTKTKSKKVCNRTTKEEGDAVNKPKKKRPSRKQIAKRNAYFEKLIENDKMYESVFDIEYFMTKEREMEEFERRKTYETYVKAQHKCEICYQVFKSSNHLKYHMEKWHTESKGSVCCSICKIWHRKYSGHKLTHIAVYKCKLCPLITHRSCSMQNHYERHKGKQYHCEQCDTTYKSKSVYNTHMGKFHKRGRHVCAGCGRGFGTTLGLSLHRYNSMRCNKGAQAQTREGGGGVRCEECDVTLPSKQVYDAHVISVHAAEGVRRRSAASDTRSLAADSAGLPPHILTSRKPRTVKCIQRKKMEHTCRVCNTIGPSFGWLLQHFKREHPNEDVDVWYADRRKHLCDVCGTGFVSVYALRDHINIHTGARPYTCDLCPKKFRNANLMRDHRLRHFPSTFTCTYCEKQFKTQSNLYTHMRIHAGVRDNKCDICGKGFLHSASLREHIRGVHHNIRRKRGGSQGATDAVTAQEAKRRKGMAVEDSECDLDSE